MIHALLIGLDEYDPRSGVRSLQGCAHDVRAVRTALERYFPAAQLRIAECLHAAATRDGVIDAFRQHLAGQAKAGDQVLLYYSGHGSYQPSAPEFAAADPRLRQDETWVLYDSRVPDSGGDLADKELAALFSELADGVGIAVVADSCHSASMTRVTLTTRFTQGASRPPALADYLNGFYTRRPAGPLLPSFDHALLAACDRDERAHERDGYGLFTRALLQALDQTNGRLTYQELFLRARHLMAQEPDIPQTPQCAAHGGFDLNRYFLSSETAPQTPWTAQHIADALVGHAQQPGVWCCVQGDAALAARLQHSLPNYSFLGFTGQLSEAEYRLDVQPGPDGVLALLYRQSSRQLVQGFSGTLPGAAKHFGALLAQVEKWERLKRLHRPADGLLAPGQLIWRIELPDGTGIDNQSGSKTLDVRYDGQNRVPFRITASQTSGKNLHIYLLQYTRQLGIYGRYDNRWPGICPETELFRDAFMIGDDATVSTVVFQVIASSAPLDLFALRQAPLADFGKIVADRRDFLEPPAESAAVYDGYVDGLSVNVLR